MIECKEINLAESMKFYIMSTNLMKTIHYAENTITISITMGNAWLQGVTWKPIHEAYTRDKPQDYKQLKKMLKITVWISLGGHVGKNDPLCFMV